MDDGYTALQINNKDILIEDQVITKIAYDIPANGCQVIDGRGKMTLPGFINARSRCLASIVSKGITEDVNCDAYGNSPLYHRVNPMLNLALEELSDPELTALLSLAVYEAIESGTTTLIDQGTGRDTALLLKLCEEKGLRLAAAPSLMSRKKLPEGSKTGVIEDEPDNRSADDEALRCMRALLEAYPGGRVQAAVGLAESEVVSDHLLREAAALAREKNALLITPFYETIHEAETVRKRFQTEIAERLKNAGALNSRTVLGGAVYADDTVLNQVKGSGAHIAHCPQEAAQDGVFSRMVAPLSMHINTALGTGRCAVNLLEQLRICALVGKLEYKRRYKVRGMYVYFAATEAGAAMLGQPGLGRIEEGCVADLITLHVDRAHHMPFQLPLTDLLYAARTEDVCDVIVDGRILKLDNQMVGFDLPALLSQAEAALQHLWSCALEKGAY